MRSDTELSQCLRVFLPTLLEYTVLIKAVKMQTTKFRFVKLKKGFVQARFIILSQRLECKQC